MSCLRHLWCAALLARHVRVTRAHRSVRTIAIMPRYIEQFGIVLSIFQGSAPTIRRIDSPVGVQEAEEAGAAHGGGQHQPGSADYL